MTVDDTAPGVVARQLRTQTSGYELLKAGQGRGQPETDVPLACRPLRTGLIRFKVTPEVQPVAGEQLLGHDHDLPPDWRSAIDARTLPQGHRTSVPINAAALHNGHLG
jgi:hypothetical protein